MVSFPSALASLFTMPQRRGQAWSHDRRSRRILAPFYGAGEKEKMETTYRKFLVAGSYHRNRLVVLTERRCRRKAIHLLPKLRQTSA